MSQQPMPLQKVKVMGVPSWEVAAIFCALGALGLAFFLGPVGWATFLMLLAIFCACMR